jgi:hypothetical protein
MGSVGSSHPKAPRGTWSYRLTKHGHPPNPSPVRRDWSRLARPFGMCYMCYIVLQHSAPHFGTQGVVRASRRKMPGCSSDKAAKWCLTPMVLVHEAPLVRDTEGVMTDELSIKKP